MPKKSTICFLTSCLVFSLAFFPIARGYQSSKPASSPPVDDKAYQELAQQVAELEKFSQVFEKVAKLVSPSVVHIQSKRAATIMDRNFTLEETGSGVIVLLPGPDASYVLTNNHVIEKVKPEQLVITTNDRRLVHAVKAWSDEDSDVAILTLAEKDVHAARLGDSDEMRIGHWVLAIGSPFDQAGSVTHGIVSGKGRRSLKLGTGGILNQDFIQTDASINPGNSGGPLVNLRGEIVGINTAIASQSGGSEGVGFSIPINLVRRIATELIQKGSITRAFLGIGTVGTYPTLDAQIASKLGLERARGGLVQSVFPDTPASQAGLQSLDVILEFNGHLVEDIDHLTHLISLTPVGQEVPLLVWRNREEKKLTATVAERSAPKFIPLGKRALQDPVLSKLGVEIQELTDGDRLRFALADQKGVMITRVTPHREVAQVIEPFDVIEQVEGKPVTSTNEVREAIRSLKPESGIRIRVARPTSKGVTFLDVTIKP